MSMQEQINQIVALRDKAVAAYDRAIAAAEKHKKEAEEYSVALGVLSKILPTSQYLETQMPQTDSESESFRTVSGPIYERILTLLKSSEKLWWTANAIQEALASQGDHIKMTSISPNLSRLKESGDIVRKDLKVALADRVLQKAEASEEDLLSGSSSEASNHHDLTNRGTQPSSLVKPWAGGGT